MDQPPPLIKQLQPYLPLLRVPLLLIDVISMSLAWAVFDITSAYRWYNIDEIDGCLALAILFTISLTQNAILVYGYFTTRKINLPDDHKGTFTTIFIAVWDLSTSLAMFVLHIVQLAFLRQTATALKGITIVGAFTASIFHFILGGAAIYLWYIANQKVKVRCPTCHQKMKRGAVVPSPRVRPMQAGSRAQVSTMANEEGLTEGDRLITPGSDE